MDSSTPPRGLPQWQSHKKVWAAKITHVELDGSNGPTLHLEGDFTAIVDNDYLNRHEPQPGGYYVRYKDGYESWSPAEVFEEGYTRIERPLDAFRDAVK